MQSGRIAPRAEERLPEFGISSRPKSDKSDFGWERAQHATSGLAATIETDWHDRALLVRYERKLREALKTRRGTSCRRSIAKPRFPGPRTSPARSPSM